MLSEERSIIFVGKYAGRWIRLYSEVYPIHSRPTTWKAIFLIISRSRMADVHLLIDMMRSRMAVSLITRYRMDDVHL